MASSTNAHATHTDPVEVVEAFFDALERLDVDEAATYLADDAVWHNVPFPPAVGKTTVVRQLTGMSRLRGAAFRVEMHNIAANGGTVLTERTDTLLAGPVGGSFWVCGTLEVEEGLITLWRDRFDLVDITASTIAGTAKNLWARLRAAGQTRS